jgi:hypothetical protein
MTFSPFLIFIGIALLKCIFHYKMPQSIWSMQERAELAWSKSVIVEVRKGDEGMLIHVPFKLSVFSAAPAQNQGAGPATRRVCPRTGF